MRLTLFRTVRGRLLALLIAIVLPIACLSAVAAVTTYRTVISAIEEAQTSTIDDFAVRARVWYRGVLRSLLTSGSLLASTGPGSAGCGRALLEQSPGYRAVYVVARGGTVACATSLDSEIGVTQLATAAEGLREHEPITPWAGAELAKPRYGHLRIAGRSHLAVYAHGDDPAGAMMEGLFLVDPMLLDQVFDLGDGDGDIAVALMARGGEILAARGDADRDPSWLPASETVPENRMRWEAPSRGGAMRSYAARLVAGPDLYVIASFGEAAERAARIQFLALLLTPLLTLALLCLVYLRAIDRHCVRWLRGIEAAARAKSSLSMARVAIADDMPRDIRSVAEAFNGMLDEQEVKQRKLQTALDDNRYLVRELHHRVKNSLQVVQSYLGLTKRDYRGEARLALADAECRVHVLSTAYRFTLADGEMQPVRVDLFLDEVVTMISNLIRRRDQWVTGQIDTAVSLPVDRIIPLGFLVVDVVSRGLRATPGLSITMTVSDIDPETIEIAFSADREIAHTAPPKLFGGLVAQIEAVQSEGPAGARLGAWRIAHHGRR